MSNDFQAQISTQIGQTLSQLKAVHAEIRQLAAATKQNNDEHGRFQKTAGDAFRQAHEGAKEATGRLREMGRAASLAGGEFGHLSELMRLFTGGGTGLLLIGAGAAVIGTAFEAWNKSLERSIDYAGKLADEESKIGEIVQKNNEARGKTALANTKNPSESSLIGAFGDPKIDEIAQSIARQTKQPIEDVRAAMLGSMKIRGGRDAQTNALNAAILFQKSGAGTLPEGMEVINQLGYAGRRGTPSEIAARARGYKLTGSVYGRPGDQAFTEAGLNTAIAAEDQAGILSQRNDINQSANATASRQQADARSGRGVYEARAEAAYAANPLLEHVVEIARSNRAIEAHLRAQAIQEYQDAGKSFIGKSKYVFESIFGFDKQHEYFNQLREDAAAPTNLGN